MPFATARSSSKSSAKTLALRVHCPSALRSYRAGDCTCALLALLRGVAGDVDREPRCRGEASPGTDRNPGPEAAGTPLEDDAGLGLPGGLGPGVVCALGLSGEPCPLCLGGLCGGLGLGCGLDCGLIRVPLAVCLGLKGGSLSDVGLGLHG